MVYLTPKTATSGGFFPNGVNGSLNSSGGSQMATMPAGVPATGGGSTAGTQGKGLFTAGGATLLAVGGIAAYANRQHTTTNQDQAS